MGLSIRAYAQHRGVSHTAVGKAIKAGRIPQEPDGTIDPAKADAAWERNTLPSQNLNATAKPVETRVATTPKVSTREVSTSQVSTPKVSTPLETTRAAAPDYQTSRAIREAYAARLAKLEYEERTGKLISAEDVSVRTFNLARRMRDRMLNLPRRLSAVFAAEQDARTIEQRMEDEIRQALEELSQ